MAKIIENYEKIELNKEYDVLTLNPYEEILKTFFPNEEGEYEIIMRSNVPHELSIKGIKHDQQPLLLKVNKNDINNEIKISFKNDGQTYGYSIFNFVKIILNNYEKNKKIENK
jgi:hypothetical protein